jgi:hypothetical protein
LQESVKHELMVSRPVAKRFKLFLDKVTIVTEAFLHLCIDIDLYVEISKENELYIVIELQIYSVGLFHPSQLCN